MEPENFQKEDKEKREKEEELDEQEILSFGTEQIKELDSENRIEQVVETENKICRDSQHEEVNKTGGNNRKKVSFGDIKSCTEENIDSASSLEDSYFMKFKPGPSKKKDCPCWPICTCYMDYKDYREYDRIQNEICAQELSAVKSSRRTETSLSLLNEDLSSDCETDIAYYYGFVESVSSENDSFLLYSEASSGETIESEREECGSESKLPGPLFSSTVSNTSYEILSSVSSEDKSLKISSSSSASLNSEPETKDKENEVEIKEHKSEDVLQKLDIGDGEAKKSEKEEGFEPKKRKFEAGKSRSDKGKRVKSECEVDSVKKKVYSSTESEVSSTSTDEMVFAFSDEDQVITSQDCQELSEELSSGSTLNFEEDYKLPLRSSTSIICTIDESLKEKDIIEMINSGMNIARLNLCHCRHSRLLERICAKVSEAEETIYAASGINAPTAIACEIQGPSIRTGFINKSYGSELEIVQGHLVELRSTDNQLNDMCSPNQIFVTHNNIAKDASFGGMIFIDHGRISLAVIDIGVDFVISEVVKCGKLGDQKLVVLQGVPLNLPLVNDVDFSDLKRCINAKVDIIIASFTSSSSTLYIIRHFLMKNSAGFIKIIAKIQTRQGVENINEIIPECDGILVSKKDLELEMTKEEACSAQESITLKCNRAGRPVIWATWMFPSMVENLIPAQEEVTEVCEAVFHGADCVMLSRKTCVSNYGIDALKQMRKICTDAEKTLSDDYFFNYNIQKKSVFTNTLEDYAIMTVDTSIKISASAIIVISTTARSVFYVAKYRPKCPVITPIRLCRRARQSNLFRGVFPLFVPGKVTDEWYEDNNTRIHLAIEYGKRKDFIKSGDTVVILFDWGKVFAATKSICVMNIK